MKVSHVSACVRACVRACVCVRVRERESEDNLHVDSIGMNNGASNTSSNSTDPRAPSSYKAPR